MDNPKIIVSGNYRFTKEELFELSETFPSDIEVETHEAEEFQAEELIPLLRFVFEPIAVGFLIAVGKDIWEAVKSKISLLINNKKSDCDVEFAFRENDKEVVFRLRTNDSEVFESSFDRVIDVVKEVQPLGFPHDEYEYNAEKDEWEKL